MLAEQRPEARPRYLRHQSRAVRASRAREVAVPQPSSRIRMAFTEYPLSMCTRLCQRMRPAGPFPVPDFSRPMRG